MSSKCPYCSKTVDAATCTTNIDAKPSKGDLSVCLYCGGLLTFISPTSVRAISNDEYKALPCDAKRELSKAIKVREHLNNRLRSNRNEVPGYQ